MSSNWEKLQRKQNRPTTARVLSVRVVNTNKSAKSARVPLTKLVQQQKQQKQQQRQQEHQQQQEERNFQNAHPCTKKTAEGKKNEVGKYIAMDCEFVGVGPNGIQSELARVSIVNFHGNTIYDQYVQPREKVTDWRTFVSGIRPSDMANAISFTQAQKEVSDLLKDRILVGHAIHHDLEALYLTHPKRDIRDTSRHTPFKQKYSKGKTPSLKKLAAEILKKDIQGGEHSSVEDARATMLIYKSDRKNFEANYAKFNPRYN